MTGEARGEENMGGDEPVTRAEFLALGEELRQSFAELREARTSAERREAKADVDDAEDAFERAARQLGISSDSLRKAAQAARKDERREELRPILAELLEEERERQREADEEAKRKAKGRPRKDDGKSKSAKDDDDTGDGDGDEPAGDSHPTAEHWGERRLSELLR